MLRVYRAVSTTPSHPLLFSKWMQYLQRPISWTIPFQESNSGGKDSDVIIPDLCLHLSRTVVQQRVECRSSVLLQTAVNNVEWCLWLWTPVGSFTHDYCGRSTVSNAQPLQQHPGFLTKHDIHASSVWHIHFQQMGFQNMTSSTQVVEV